MKGRVGEGKGGEGRGGEGKGEGQGDWALGPRVSKSGPGGIRVPHLIFAVL